MTRTFVYNNRCSIMIIVICMKARVLLKYITMTAPPNTCITRYDTSGAYFFSYCDTRPMSIIFVAKPLNNASIMTAFLLRVDTTKNMLNHYNIYIILLKRETSVGSVCTFISAHGFLSATCPLDPGFDAMYLVAVQWRQN